MTEMLSLDVPVNEVRSTPFTSLLTGSAFEELLASVQAHGVLMPLIVREAPLDWCLHEGRLGTQRGWFCLRSELLVERRYLGPTPAFYPTKPEARQALPPPRPYEVIAGYGNKRLLAATLAKRKTIPILISEYKVEQFSELNRWLQLRGGPVG